MAPTDMFIGICTVENMFPCTTKFLFCCPQNGNVKYTIQKKIQYKPNKQIYGIK